MEPQGSQLSLSHSRSPPTRSGRGLPGEPSYGCARTSHVDTETGLGSAHRVSCSGSRTSIRNCAWRSSAWCGARSLQTFSPDTAFRSLLEPHNIPLVSREHDVTLLLYTDRPTQDFLDRCDSFKSLSRFVKVELLPLEQLPAAARTNHWVPWQHAVAGRNRDFDRFLVIIPDCVYAAGSLGTIIDALEEHDTVYYTLPQVCRETVAVELDGLRRVDDHEYISFTSLPGGRALHQARQSEARRSCLLRHVLRQSSRDRDPALAQEHGRLRDRITSFRRQIEHTQRLLYLDALSPGAKTCYLEILGVSAEPALKFVEEYYRWPKLFRDHSRLMGLGRWACLFRDASDVAYSKSAIHITLDQGRVLEQHRGQVKRAKTRFVNATLDWLAVATRIYERARAISRCCRGKIHCARHGRSWLPSSSAPPPVGLHRCPAQDRRAGSRKS